MITDCKHENTETRSMKHCNQIKLQCLDCGQSVGHAIRHASIAPEVLITITDFDYDFRDLMQEKMSEERKAAWTEKNAEWLGESPKRKAEYAEYLMTPQWREKREKVIDRENGLCQGCRVKRIDEVHHLTYDNRGDELLFQLVGLCSPCHAKAHHTHP